MATPTTKVYYNEGDQTIELPAIDTVLKPGEHISVTSAYHPPVIVENFPGLKEITDLPDEEQAQHRDEVLAAEAKAPKKPKKESTDEQG